jgi:hypothetical protein
MVARIIRRSGVMTAFQREATRSRWRSLRPRTHLKLT